MDRKVRAGQIIKLRAKFLDDLGDEVQASAVRVHIFEPDKNTSSLANAILVSGSPTYFGNGIFEYSYTVPGCGPDGEWNDQWEGDLTCQDLFGEFSFEVAGSGTVQSFSNQLNINNIIEVTLHSGIRDTTGVGLEEEEVFSFLTTASPSYTSVRKIRLEAGGFLTNVLDDAIQMSIVEASLEADLLTFETNRNTDFYNHVRREWTTCRTALTLLTNVGNHMLKSKTLDNLSVTYDTQGLRTAMEKAFMCQNKWEQQLMTGGLAKAAQNPRGVVKGEMDPDRPIAGRGWIDNDTGPGSLRGPAGNSEVQPTGSRRSYKIFNPNKRWW